MEKDPKHRKYQYRYIIYPTPLGEVVDIEAVKPIWENRQIKKDKYGNTVYKIYGHKEIVNNI